MTEKIVDMAKLAPFGLPTPTEADKKSLEPPSKKFKAAGNQNKLWTHDARMINEKFIYLNKSTTKYVIIGNDAETFLEGVKICDRTNGSHITFRYLPGFKEIVDGIITKGEQNPDLESKVGVNFMKLSDGIWKIKEENGFGTIVLQKISLENFLYCYEILYNHWFNRWNSSDALKSAAMGMRSTLANLDADAKKKEILSFIEKGNSNFITGGFENREERLKHCLATSIITCRPYLHTLEEYKDFY